jgi:hypothetical protein
VKYPLTATSNDHRQRKEYSVQHHGCEVAKRTESEESQESERWSWVWVVGVQVERGVALGISTICCHVVWCVNGTDSSNDNEIVQKTGSRNDDSEGQISPGFILMVGSFV